MAFGSLLIFDLDNCNGNINDKDLLQSFINELVIDIMQMKIIGETQFAYFEPNEFNIKNDLVGFSITTIISLSSITIHICDLSKKAYIDIFTCCSVNDEMVMKIKDLIIKVFNPMDINKKIIERPVK